MQDLALREEIISTCRWLRQEGFVFSTWGNVSVRMPDGNILITPSRVDYDEMQPEDLVVLSPEGEVVSGSRLSTSEREIHLGVMKKRRDVGAIIHTHSPYAMAVCARDGGIPPFTEELCQLIGGHVPISRSFVPSSQHRRLGQVVVEAVTDANAVLIRNHGPVCFSRDLAQARVCCQILEKSARIYLALLSAGGLQTIPEEAVQDGRSYFLYSYGKT